MSYMYILVNLLPLKTAPSVQMALGFLSQDSE